MPKKLTTKEFIKRAIEVHGDKYDYSKTIYENSQTKVKIICPIHGEFRQTPQSHLSGNGCMSCGKISMSEKLSSNTKKFIKRAIEVRGDKYDYSETIYENNKTKVKIICPMHGEFYQTPNNHLRGNNCPKCNIVYKGEERIRKFLMSKKINFIEQKRYENCKNKLTLPFDFYLPKLNVLIEYHGMQHYQPVKHFGGEKAFIKRQKRDLIKENYAKENNIKLIVIPYTEIDRIEEMLIDQLKLN